MPRDSFPIYSHTAILFRILNEISQGNTKSITRDEIFEQFGRERAVEWIEEKFGQPWPIPLDEVERAGLNRALASTANVIDVERKWIRGGDPMCILACFFVELCQSGDLVDGWIDAVREEMATGKYRREEWN